jgi:hypothetical protein
LEATPDLESPYWGINFYGNLPLCERWDWYRHTVRDCWSKDPLDYLALILALCAYNKLVYYMDTGSAIDTSTRWSVDSTIFDDMPELEGISSSHSDFTSDSDSMPALESPPTESSDEL